MKQVLKVLFVLFVTAVCLTSDTTSSSTAVKASVQKFKIPELCYSTSSCDFVVTTPMPRYLAYRKSTLLLPMLP